MTNSTDRTSLRAAALIAGIGLLVMVIAAPFAELYVFPKLVVRDDALETAKNIMANEPLFIAAIFGYLITFIADVVVAWALYVLLKPVHDNLSLITAWFRLVYTVLALVALNNLITVVQLLATPDYGTLFGPDELYAQAMVHLRAFKTHWYFGFPFFGIHLGLLGYLILRSNYIPKLLGMLVIMSGLGYTVTSVAPYLFPNADLHIAKYTYYGELVFMLWLLIKGSRMHEPLRV